MRHALFTSRNLIGDALYISPALNQWHRDHPDFEIDILTLDDHVRTLYEGMGVPVRRVYTDEVDGDYYDFKHTFDVTPAFKLSDQRKCHIAESYAALLGVQLEPQPLKLHCKPIFEPTNTYVPDNLKGLVLISMFSRSCTSQEKGPDGKLLGKPPNKMLPWQMWRMLIDFLERREWGEIKFLGGKADRDSRLRISEDQYLLGLPLPETAAVMKHAKLLVTVDNGMGHLAASQDCPTFLFYPQALGLHYIVPPNPYLRLLHMNPLQLRPEIVLSQMRIEMPKVFVQKEGEGEQNQNAKTTQKFGAVYGR